MIGYGNLRLFRPGDNELNHETGMDNKRNFCQESE